MSCADPPAPAQSASRSPTPNRRNYSGSQSRETQLRHHRLSWPWPMLRSRKTVPLPRPRPFADTETAPVRRSAPAAPTTSAAPTTPTVSACRVRLTAQRAIAPSVDAIEGPGECGNDDLVRLEAVVLADNSRVEISPPAVLRCSMAEAIVDWVRDDLAQLARIQSRLAAALGAKLRRLSLPQPQQHHRRDDERARQGQCARHPLVTLINGKTIDPTDPHVSREFRESWKKSVCARFSTVLGPGSDGYHENHIHVDLMERAHRLSRHVPVGRPPAGDQAGAGGRQRRRSRCRSRARRSTPAAARSSGTFRQSCLRRYDRHAACPAISPPATSNRSSIPTPISRRSARPAR